jgi:hypothetical protein
VSRDYLLQISFMNHLPPSPRPKITLGSFWKFPKIRRDICKSRRQILPPVPVPLICHRCQRHRWQIMGTIPDCWNLKVNLKKQIYLYVDSTTQKCSKKCKHFLIEDIFDLPPESMTPVVHLKLRISPRIFEKIRNCPLKETYQWDGFSVFLNKSVQQRSFTQPL